MIAILPINPAAPCSLWLTTTIEAELRRRNVFPTLRGERGKRRGAYFEFNVTENLIEHLLEDARDMHQTDGTPSNLRRAYGALARNLDNRIQHEKRKALEAVTVPDPGYEMARAESIKTPACFQILDVCIVWLPGHSKHGTFVEIIGSYDFRAVTNPDGFYLAKDGSRFDYKWGYMARNTGGKALFYAAGNLRYPSGSPCHLKLVSGAKS